ncbi:MAG TPA: ChaN family lipoprotein [Polyangiaceae bacterium]
MRRALVFALALAACASPPPRSPIAWTTTVRASNPLVGRTYDERKHAFVDFQRASHAATESRFVLLGEKHDNADHHRLQAETLAAIARARHPAVVFEMIDLDLQPAIDAYLATGRATLDGLRGVLQWVSRGWPSWELYRPIFEVVLRARLKIVAAGLPHDVIRRLVHDGLSALPPEIAARVHLHPLPPTREASLDDEIKASHCGMLPDTMIAPMSLAQRVKDALMADLMSAQPGGAVLVAGNGHVRSDRAVPFELERRSVVVSFVEVDASIDPATYAVDQPADFIVFTPRVDDEDPCAKFRAK